MIERGFLDSEKSGRKDRREKIFHIDDNPGGQETDTFTFEKQLKTTVINILPRATANDP